MDLPVEPRGYHAPTTGMDDPMASVELYTTAICPYCVAAKNLLKQKGLDYAEIRVDLDLARRDEMLSRSGGRRSVPQIFINDIHVGGFDDLVAADRSGRLAGILGQA
jgi:glutaredoxin 3